MNKIIIMAFILSVVFNTSSIFAQYPDPNSMTITEAQLKEFEKEAKKGSFEAQFGLGSVYLMGAYGVTQDITKGLYWTKKAAETGAKIGDATAIALYCAMLLEHPEYSDNPDGEILIWANRGKQLNNSSCMTILGEHYLKNGNVKDGLANLNQAAYLGEPISMGRLSYLYLGNEGMAQDFSLALNWANKGTEIGNPSAMRTLALIYSQGLGVDKDIDKGIEYGEKAANAGVNCDDILVNNYLNSTKFENNRKGFEWLKAHQGDKNPEIWHVLGVCYESGKGTMQDTDKAVQWYELAEMAGHTQSVIRMARASLYGELGKTRDEASALQALDKLNDEDIIEANIELAQWYYDKNDGEKALKYLNKSQEILDKGLGKSFLTQSDIYEMIGNVYFNESSGVTDIDKAKQYYLKIKEKDDAAAYHVNQSKLYYSKEFGMQDYEKSVEHLRKVTECTNRSDYLYLAYKTLSSAYRYGRGVEANEAKADEMLKKAESYDTDLNMGVNYRRTSDLMKSLGIGK